MTDLPLMSEKVKEVQPVPASIEYSIDSLRLTAANVTKRKIIFTLFVNKKKS